MVLLNEGSEMNVVSQYRGMERGHPVKVKGHRGSFEFHAVYITDAGEVSSVCVVGGTANHRMFRHFTADRIVAKRVRKS